MTQTRREAAQELADALLDDIDSSRIGAPELVRRIARLARLLDDTEAQEWLSHEMRGYTQAPGKLTASEVTAATRSGRMGTNELGRKVYFTVTVDRLQAGIDAARKQMEVAGDVSFSISTANPVQPLRLPTGNGYERTELNKLIIEQSAILGKIVAALHEYVSERAIELRFGAAVESAFAVVRNRVDARIASLVPAGATKFAAAFESASSGNPEHWANAASECRRLLKAIADALRPPGDPVRGRAMTDDKYINRLIDWIESQKAIGATTGAVVTSDLEDFGKRIDAFDNAGHKGAHGEVTQYEASRFITGAYLLIGDILDLWQDVKTAEASTVIGVETTAGAEVSSADGGADRDQ